MTHHDYTRALEELDEFNRSFPDALIHYETIRHALEAMAAKPETIGQVSGEVAEMMAEALRYAQRNECCDNMEHGPSCNCFIDKALSAYAAQVKGNV